MLIFSFAPVLIYICSNSVSFAIPLIDGRENLQFDHNLLRDEAMELLSGRHKTIPTYNYRRLVVTQRNPYKANYEEATSIYRKRILDEIPMFESKEKIQKLQLLLLDRGILVKCFWFNPLPPPLNLTDECTVDELEVVMEKFPLNRNFDWK